MQDISYLLGEDEGWEWEEAPGGILGSRKSFFVMLVTGVFTLEKFIKPVIFVCVCSFPYLRFVLREAFINME